MSAVDPAYQKGEAAVQPEDRATDALTRAVEHGYLVADQHRDAFLAGFFSALRKNPRVNDHTILDEQKRLRAMEILEHFDLKEIRSVSLATLARWRSQGTWCSAYSEWKVMMSTGSDETIIMAMTGLDQESTRLRQSPPYTAFHQLLNKSTEKDLPR